METEFARATEMRGAARGALGRVKAPNGVASAERPGGVDPGLGSEVEEDGGTPERGDEMGSE